MRYEHAQLVAALLVGACGALGCSSGGDVNIGDTSAVGSKLSDYAASWDGYAQAYGFWPGGSDRVRLTIDAQGHGNLRIGDTDLLPPPTDPGVFNPSDIALLPDWSNLVEGGLYTAHAARVQAGRVQFGINPWELFAAWCALQTPFPIGPPGTQGNADGSTGITFADGGGTFDYTCSPQTLDNAGSCTSTDWNGQSQPIDCAKAWLCTGVYACGCTETACGTREIPDATAANQYPDEFDAALDRTGKTLTGTLNLDGNRITVVMHKH